jgi:multiple sugar transport system permease protein
MRLSRRETFLLCLPLAVLLGGWLVIPAALGLAATLTTYGQLGSAVRFVGLANYAAVVRHPEFGPAVRNVLVLTVVGVPLQLAIGFGIASLLRRPFPGRALARVLLLLPWLLSPIGSGVMWHFLFDSATGPIDFILGWIGLSGAPSPAGTAALALPTVIAVELWRLAPLAAFLLLPGLEAIPDERWEDATLDGVGLVGRIRNVAIPSIRPLLLAVTLLLIGLSLGTFDTILILTGGGPGSATMTPALFSYQTAFETGNWPVGAAAAWLLAFGVLAVGAVYLRLARRTT